MSCQNADWAFTHAHLDHEGVLDLRVAVSGLLTAASPSILIMAAVLPLNLIPSCSVASTVNRWFSEFLP